MSYFKIYYMYIQTSQQLSVYQCQSLLIYQWMKISLLALFMFIFFSVIIWIIWFLDIWFSFFFFFFLLWHTTYVLKQPYTTHTNTQLKRLDDNVTQGDDLLVWRQSYNWHFACQQIKFHSPVSTVEEVCALHKWAATWQNQQSEWAPSEDSEHPGHPSSLIRVFAVRMKKHWVLSYPLSPQRRFWSDWADAQADLSLRWTHTHFVGLSCRGSSI